MRRGTDGEAGGDGQLQGQLETWSLGGRSVCVAGSQSRSRVKV